MTIECTTCHARYTIADGLVPPQGARVRCKKCSTVILVKPAGAPSIPAPTETTLVPPSPEPAPAPAPEPVAPPAPAPAIPSAAAVPAFTSSIFEPSIASAPQAPAPEPTPIAPARETPPLAVVAPALQPAAAPASTIPKGTPIPEGLSPEDHQKHERARRLARVLASDVAIYNREKRERSIQEGNLVAALGYEIKKSWETYKERVGTDFANATPYFRDALNEIVAEGKKIF